MRNLSDGELCTGLGKRVGGSQLGAVCIGGSAFFVEVVYSGCIREAPLSVACHTFCSMDQRTNHPFVHNRTSPTSPHSVS